MDEIVPKPELSRTSKKKYSHLLQKLGECLVEINPAQLKSLDLPEELLEALGQARSFTRRGARRRQMQYIGRLMLQLDEDQIGAVQELLSELGAIPRGKVDKI